MTREPVLILRINRKERRWTFPKAEISMVPLSNIRSNEDLKGRRSDPGKKVFKGHLYFCKCISKW
jgi:hypothetical protein